MDPLSFPPQSRESLSNSIYFLGAWFEYTQVVVLIVIPKLTAIGFFALLIARMPQGDHATRPAAE